MDGDDDHDKGIRVGSVHRPVPGWNVQLLSAETAEDDIHHGHNHESEEPDKELVVKLPLPPGTFVDDRSNGAQILLLIRETSCCRDVVDIVQQPG